MSRQSPFRVFLIIVWMGALAFLSACGNGQSFGAATPSPIATCISPEISNPYSNGIDKVVAFYQIYLNNQSDPNMTIDLRKEAFLRLVELVQFESSTHIISQGDSRSVRATVTLLSSEIIQYIILNQFLYNISTHSILVTADNPEYSGLAFQERLRSALDDVARRQELLFLITVTYPPRDVFLFDENEFVVEIPFEEIQLINASDEPVYAVHDDHNLNAPPDTLSDSISGLVSFPLGARTTDGCKQILDRWNTSVTLQLNNIRVGNKPVETRMWTVPYYPLIYDDFIHHGEPHYHKYEYIALDTKFLTKASTPPTVIENTTIGDSLPFKEYWWQVSQYLWHVVITLSHY